MSSEARCTAILWHRARRCPRPAAAGSTFCATHLSLIAPMNWATASCGAPPTAFQAAGQAAMTDEIALARLKIRDLLDAGSPPDQLLDGLRTLTSMVRLQHRIKVLANHRHLPTS
jgi:hypothetical protein